MDYRWDDLRVFLALYRQRTLAGAGAKVGLDASTVSRRLSGLEEALGATLFDRSRDGVTPTDAAEQLFPAAEAVELASLTVLHVAEGLDGKVEGLVRITAPPLAVDAFLAPALPLFRTQLPDIRIELHASASFADLTRREADLALRTVRPTSGDLVGVRVASAAPGVFASPAFAKRHGTVKSWDDLPWATWGDDLAQLPTFKWLENHAPKALRVLRSNSLGAQLVAAQAGAAAVLTSDIAAARFGLVPLRAAAALRSDLAELPADELWLIGHRALRNVPRIAAVWDFLLQQFSAYTRPRA